MNKTKELLNNKQIMLKRHDKFIKYSLMHIASESFKFK